MDNSWVQIHWLATHKDLYVLSDYASREVINCIHLSCHARSISNRQANIIALVYGYEYLLVDNRVSMVLNRKKMV